MIISLERDVAGSSSHIIMSQNDTQSFCLPPSHHVSKAFCSLLFSKELKAHEDCVNNYSVHAILLLLYGRDCVFECILSWMDEN